MLVARNVLANYLGQVWRVFILLAFVPLYIEYMGVEAYGLVGVFTTLQAWLGLLDLGARPTLAREMARFTARAQAETATLELFRTVELLTIGMGGAVFLAVYLSSPWLASSWVNAGNLTQDTVRNCFALMGLIIACRFLENAYNGSLAGLQRQVTINAISMVMQTVQAGGAVAVLVFLSPTVEAFFAWQAALSAASAGIYGFIVHRSIPSPRGSKRFSWSALRSIWRFALGMVGITATTLLLTQVDKILLSHWMSLEAFAYYALAGLIAGGLDLFTAPVSVAVFPRFVELVVQSDERSLSRIYHKGAQLITVCASAAAAILIIDSERAVFVWTANHVLAEKVGPILRILALGTLLHCMIWIPYQLQLANGWTKLSLYGNLLAASVLVPALFMIAPKYGAVGVAWIWVVLNLGYLLVSVQIMHRVLLPKEKWPWYFYDVALPMGAAFAAAALIRSLGLHGSDRLRDAALLASSALATILSAAMVAPLVRREVRRYAVAALNMVRQ